MEDDVIDDCCVLRSEVEDMRSDGLALKLSTVLSYMFYGLMMSSMFLPEERLMNDDGK